MNSSELLVFWAKTPQNANAPPHWHPLLCHMLDVGAVAEALWEDVLSPWVRAWAAGRLCLAEPEAGRCISFWSGIHDLGKCSRTFQFQDGHGAKRLQQKGYKAPEGPLEGPHGTVSARALVNIFRSRFGYPELTAWRLACAIGGHHGVIPTSQAVESLTSEALGQGRWNEARDELTARLSQLLGVPHHAVPVDLTAADALWVAGLISVADWIGSNKDFFPLAATDPDAIPDFEPDWYLRERARPQASRALHALGWMARPADHSRHSFADQFGFNPNVMQADIGTICSDLHGPGLVIVEAPMGEGKTEVGLLLANHWDSAVCQTGLYFALPTQATSNQMFSRLRAYLERRYPGTAINVQLLHGHSSLSGELHELRRNGYRLFQPTNIDVDRNDEQGWTGRPAVLAAQWFTHRKRGLLSPFGVGTVDQALLAALQTRHVFVRLFGLGGKTVIVDEVHAYDTYMSTLLEQLLRWLAALGTSVVLLSATLPDERRRQLVRAYADGLGRPAREIPAASYPRATWVGGEGQPSARTLRTSSGARRTLSLLWTDDLLSSLEHAEYPLGESLKETLSSGGCAAIICDTVGRAQHVYRALQPYFPGMADDGLPQLDLFHARYPFEERDARERRALLRFGKEGTIVDFGVGQIRQVQRPDRAVLVATQVVEQSLDLDFDVMVSDMAPVDLLLQRSGRLHRHPRARPDSVQTPVLWIGRPNAMDGDVPRFEKGIEYVYDPHVLLRSWLALHNRVAVRVPEDVSGLIEMVYDERPCPAEFATAVRRVWEETKDAATDEVKKEELQAKLRYIKRPDYSGELAAVAHEPRDDDAPDLHPTLQALTRLSEPSAAIVCLYGTPERPYLDRSETKRTTIRGEPTIRRAEGLLRRSASIADKRVVRALLDIQPPAGWQRSPLLRHHRPLFFEDRLAPIPGTKHMLRLDAELGLVVIDSRKEEA